MAIALGIDSVMVDGSAWDYEKNVQWTKTMAEHAHDKVREKTCGQRYMSHHQAVATTLAVVHGLHL